MIVIGQVRFEFGMEDEPLAFDLYSKWDGFCRSGFTDVAERVLMARENADVVLHIDRLELDLGSLTEDEFYDQFPGRLEECLKEALRGLLSGAETAGVKRYTGSAACYEQLIYYLVHGYMGWDCREWSFDLKQYLLRILAEEAEKFRRFLLMEGGQERVRKRLVYRLDDGILEALVTLTVSREAAFINRYTGFVIQNYPRLHRYQVPRQDYRNTLWILVLTYIWSVNKGRINRKELVDYTLRKLAAHLGIGVLTLVGYLMKGVEELLSGDVVRHELLEILEEIRYEEKVNCLVALQGDSSVQMVKEVPRGLLKKVFVSSVDNGLFEKNPEGWPEELQRQLADTVRRRILLQGLRETEIEWIVKILIPSDSEFIVNYARVLEAEKERGRYEGKAGDEFRYVKWDFIFGVLLERSFANLDRKQFVSGILHRLAAHYGLEYWSLLGYFRQIPGELPGWLAGVLVELEEERNLSVWDQMKKTGRRLTEEEEKRVLGMLMRPLSCRRLLSQLNELEITNLVRRFLPQDPEFILEYAGRLTSAKDQGMFEGRAGSEFGLLRWEFIFQLALADTFNRKQFALRLLRELAAHYALEVKNLLRYFYQYLAGLKGGKSVGFWETIRDLWMEAEQELVVLKTELRIENEWDERLAVLERYLLTGRMSGGERDMYVLFMELRDHVPKRLKNRLDRMPGGWLACDVEQSGAGVRFYAALLLWWLDGYSFVGNEQTALQGMLQSALAGSGKAEVRELRCLLACCLEGREVDFQKILDGRKKIGFRFSEADFLALWILLLDYRRKEVADFLRNRKEEWKLLIFSPSTESRTFRQKLWAMAEMDRGLADFLTEILEVEVPKGVPAAEGMDRECLWACLSAGRELPGQREQIEKWRTDRRSCLRVLRLLQGNPVYQKLWIERVGSIGLRRLADELLRLEKQVGLNWDKKEVWELLVKYTLPEYANLNVEELYLIFIRALSGKLTSREKERVSQAVMKEVTGFAFWKNALGRLPYVPGPSALEKRRHLPSSGTEEELMLIEVRNAGLVLFAPWMIQLFGRLNLLQEDKKAFASVDEQVRGAFILQALVDGTEIKDYEEHELFLNRLLVNLPVEEVLPSRIEWKDGEAELIGSLTENLRLSWPKMKNTSLEGLRHSFLQREGMLEEQEGEWKLTVHPKGLDVLLDSLPWGFSMVRLPWMDKILRVAWR